MSRKPGRSKSTLRRKRLKRALRNSTPTSNSTSASASTPPIEPFCDSSHIWGNWVNFDSEPYEGVVAKTVDGRGIVEVLGIDGKLHGLLESNLRKGPRRT